MAEANDIRSIIYQNLEDAGCDEQITKKCMSLVSTGNFSQMLPILSKYRSYLLGSVRIGQKQLDCLDYLIFKIKNKSI